MNFRFLLFTAATVLLARAENVQAVTDTDVDEHTNAASFGEDNSVCNNMQNDRCDKQYEPVCASDGNTYATKCVMCNLNSLLSVVSQGECPTRKSVRKCEPSSNGNACTLNYYPVCASNGQTYPNFCTMCSENPDLRVSYIGECHVCHEHVGKACPKIYAPVCANNGKTFDNKCHFCNEYKENKFLEIKHFGTCQNCPTPRDDGACDRSFSPVCASDKNVYDNFCLFCLAVYNQPESSNLEVKDDSYCDGFSAEDHCDKYVDANVCPLLYKPVCCSHSVTFSNLCEFCQAAKNIFWLKFQGNGPCPVNCPGSFKACPKIYQPLCAYDKISDELVTLANRCEFCNRKLEENEHLIYKHGGVCIK